MNSNKWSQLTRRQFISKSAQAALGVNIGGHFLNAQGSGLPNNNMKFLMLYMGGGMSHLDTFDLHPGTKENGPNEGIATTGDLRISKHLAGLAPQMKHLAVINSMMTTQGAHDKGNYYMHTGYPQIGTIVHPTVGSWSAYHQGKINQTMPGNVVIGPNSIYPYAGFMEPALGALPIMDPDSGLQNSKIPEWASEDVFHDQLEMANHFDRAFRETYKQRQVQAYDKFYTDALQLMKSQDLKAFDIHQESDADKARYGDTKFGKGCLLARRLIESGVRCVEVQRTGWDSHNEYPEEQQQDLGRAFGALMQDLSERGLLSTTIVALCTEFGRNPEIRLDTGGRDHWAKAFTCLIGGGAIRGGQVYGKTDRGHEVTENKVTPPDLHATIGHAMGIDHKKVIMSESGRPFNMGHKGKVVHGLF